MTHPELVIAEFMDEQVVASTSEFRVAYVPELDRPELLALLAEARGLIVRNQTSVDLDLLAAAPRLEVVGRLGVGLDNIDVEACEQRGILVKPATGANADAVAEYVIAAILVLSRGVFLSSDRVETGEWPRRDLVGMEVAGKTLGLIGAGDIARRVAARAGALGMDVVAYDPYLPSDHVTWDHIESVSLVDLVACADAVSIHVPLHDTTADMIGEAAIGAMKPTAVLVNTSRGGIIDEAALVEALRQNRLRGAALDVFATEPVTESSGRAFKDVPNLILTPHVAGVTAESNVRVSEMTMRQVVDVLNGSTQAW